MCTHCARHVCIFAKVDTMLLINCARTLLTYIQHRVSVCCTVVFYCKSQLQHLFMRKCLELIQLILLSIVRNITESTSKNWFITCIYLHKVWKAWLWREVDFIKFSQHLFKRGCNTGYFIGRDIHSSVWTNLWYWKTRCWVQNHFTDMYSKVVQRCFLNYNA